MQDVRTFGTMTDDLLALADWLAEAGLHPRGDGDRPGCTGSRSGTCWRTSFALLLVNARHIKAVPGRKTDVKDAEWIADLLRHGLLRGSFVPDRPQRELRELTRYRTSLVRERTAEANRLQKTLEGANIKLAAVATDILGTSGREMLQALVAGPTDAAALAHLAKGRLREKLPELERALTGRVDPAPTLPGRRAPGAHRLPGGGIARVSAEIAERLQPVRRRWRGWTRSPGSARTWPKRSSPRSART